MAKDEIDLSDVTKAVAEIKTTFEAFKDTHATQLAELKKGVADPLLDEKLAKINTELDKKQELIDKLWVANKRKHLTIDGKEANVEDLDKKALAWAQINAKARGTRVETFTHEDQKAYGVAFEAYLRKDDRVLSADEQKTLSAGSDPDGGYVVSPDTSGRMILKQFETSPMRQFASVQVISTDALEGLADLADVTSGWVGETAARAETTTPTLQTWRIPVHEQYAAPRATQKILDDAAIDMESWLASKVADKFSREENIAFTTGNGINRPRGFATYLHGTTWGTLEQTPSGASAAFDAAPDGGDAFLTMIYSMKSKYLGNASWFMNRLTTGAARLMKDSEGRYIWQPSMTASQPSSIFGYPVARFDDMANFSTAGALAVAFGDMAQAYQIVDRMGIRTLRDPYTAKPYVIFYTTKRVGGDIVDFEALKLMKMATTV